MYPTVGIKANHGLEFKTYELENFIFWVLFKSALCLVSEIFIKSKLEFFCIFGIYSTRREDRWVARRRRRPDAPSRAATRIKHDGT